MMEQYHKNILRQNAVLLTRDLDVTEEFLAVFAEKGILSDANREELLIPLKISSRKSSEFQMMLQKKGPKAFSAFLEALIRTNQSHVADKLDPELTDEIKRQLEEEESFVHMQETIPSIGNPQQPFFGQQAAGNIGTDNDALMKIAVRTSSLDLLKTHAKNVGKGTAYDVKHWPRGNFVVINNEYFHEKSERQGSKYDVINLSELAKSLEFKDICKNIDTSVEYKNLTGDALKSEILALSKRDYSEHDAFIISIMSHGANGVVYGVDGVAVNIESDICAPFDGKHCPTLSGKPKVFILQACQGEAAVTGVPQADDDEGDARLVPDLNADLNAAFLNLRMGDQAGSMPIKMNNKISHKSDMIVAYSTVKGYKSWRRPDLGSWFVRAIVTVFSQHAHEEDLQSLFTMVKNKVSAEKTSYAAGDEYVQMPRTDDTLRKKWYFLPGKKRN